jgi:hypothetical protein
VGEDLKEEMREKMGEWETAQVRGGKAGAKKLRRQASELVE